MRFVDSTLVLLATHSIGLVITFLVSVIVSRVLGPAGKGTFSLLLSLASILFGVSNLGLGFASQYFISRDPRSARGQFGIVTWYPLLAATITVTLFIATFPIWQPALNGLVIRDLLPVFVMLPLMLIFESHCHLLIVLSQIAQRSAAILTQSLVLLCASAALLALGADATAVSYAYALGWLCGGTVTAYFVVRRIGWPARPSFSLLVSTMRYSGWVWLANMIRGVVLRVDFLVLFAMRGPGEAGIYSVALALTSGMTVAFQAVVTVFHPRTSSKSDSEAVATTPQFYRGMMMLMVVIGVITALLGYPMLHVFGAEFVQGYAAMLILITAVGVNGLNAILNVHILGRGKPHIITITTTASLLIALAVNLICVPRFGLIGAALATFLVYLIENLMLSCIYRFVMQGNLRELYRLSATDFRTLTQEIKSSIRRLGTVQGAA